VGFEGGQMPLQRRLPKVGFNSRKAATRSEVRLHELAKVSGADVLDLAALKAAGIVPQCCDKAKVIASGKLAGPVKLKGIGVTAGARTVIETAGGSIED
jgi:large subunit ribosomal protein L15